MSVISVTNIHCLIVWTDLVDESCCSHLDSFGHISPVRHVDRGWLNVESVVQLKLYNNPVELWKQRQTKVAQSGRTRCLA